MPHPLSRLPLRLSLLAALLSAASLRAQTTAPAATEPAIQSAATAPAPASDAWFTLFRASDPALWNTDGGDPAATDGFATAIVHAPENLRYLRLKRMDTGDAVIVQLTRDDLPSKVLPGRCFVWAGGARHFGPATIGYVGIAELAYAARDPGDFYVFQNGRGDAGYGGFGFGKAIGSDDQRYFWNNAPIGKTAFEIAVTAADLSTTQRKELLIPGKLEVFSAQWGTVGKRVDVIKKLMAHVEGDGDLEMPVTTATLGPILPPPAGGDPPEIVVDYAINGEKRVATLPQGRNLWLIAPAIVGAPPLPPPSNAPPAPVAAPEADAAGWTVLFRGDDPALWNTNTGNPDMITGFAAAADKAPDLVLYLRLRRLDTGESVIIPITRDALAAGGPVNGVMFWNAGTQTWRGVRLLGIAQQADPADQPGDAFVYRDALTDGGWRGWGFAKIVGQDFQPAYSWNGRPIDRTTFEIAVKSKLLTAAERTAMLLPGRLLIQNAAWGIPGKMTDISRKLQNLVANGALELPLSAGDLLGPEIPRQTRTLTLSWEANGIHQTRKFSEGQTLSIAAPVITATPAAARSAYPTMEEITAAMQSSDYLGTLRMINQVLPLTGEPARSYDRYTLFLDRAECLIQSKDRPAALGALQLAAKEAKDPVAGAEALALAALLQHAPNGNYVPAGAKPPGIPITKPADRKAAYESLWADQQSALDKALAAADAAPSLPPLLAAADAIPLARAAEIMATGKAVTANTAAKSLAKRAASLIAGQIAKDSQRADDIASAAANAHQLSPDQISELRATLSIYDQLAPTLTRLDKALAPDDAPLEALPKSADTLRTHIRDIATRRY